MATGLSSSVYSAYSSVRSIPRTSPSELTISVTTRPHPPRRLTSRRKAVSVMPAIGASATGSESEREPIFMKTPARRQDSVCLHIRRIDFNRDALATQLDGQHEPRVRSLSDQASDDAT